MAYSSPYNYGKNQLPDGSTDEEDGSQQAQPQTVQPVQQTAPQAPAPYQEKQAKPQLESDSGTSSKQPAAPPQTFAQMQESGLARPPMPASSGFMASMMPTGGAQIGNTTPTGAVAPPATIAQPATSGPPAYTGPAHQDQNTQGIGYSTQNPNDGTWVFDDVSGNLVNKNTGEVYRGQSDYGRAHPGDIAGQNAAVNQFNSNNSQADWAAYANALNSQQGYAGSGMPYLDPNNPPAWWGQVSGPNQGGGAPYNTLPNPVDQPPNPDLMGFLREHGWNQIGGQGSPPLAKVGGMDLSGAGPNLVPPQSPTLPKVPGPDQGGTMPPPSGTGGSVGGGAGGTANPSAPSGTFDLLGALTGGAAGTGAGSDIQKATAAAFLKYLQNPNPYGAQDVKDQYNYLAGNIDDQYSLDQQKLGEEMARRGLGSSTIYGGRLQDLNIGKRSAKEALATDLAHNFAQNYGSSQQGALGLGNTLGTSAQNNAQSWLQQLMGYGQQAFNNDLATNAQSQSASQAYQNWILQLLGLGYS